MPQELGQPLMLISTRRVSRSSIAISCTLACTARFSPIDGVMPSLQLSVPGQLRTSVTSSAPAPPRPSSSSAFQTA